MSYRALCVSRLRLYVRASLAVWRRTRALYEPLPVRNIEETARLAFGAGFGSIPKPACPPPPHSRLDMKRAIAPPRASQKKKDTTPTRPTREESRAARGKDKNKNQDYNAAATTTAGTAAARARLCAEPRAQVSKAIAPAWCAAASSIGTT